jgi:hypothetical protein
MLALDMASMTDMHSSSLGSAAERFSELTGLSRASGDALFNMALAEDFFVSLPWFRTLAGHGSAPDSIGLFYTSGGDAGGRAGLIAQQPPRGMGGLGPRMLRSLTNFYSCSFSPLLEDRERPAAITPLIESIMAERPHWDVVNLDSLDAEGAAFSALVDVFAKHGWPVQRYFHFGNWYETTAGMTAAHYFAARPGNLRSTLKRHAAKLKKTSSFCYRMFDSPGDIEEGIALYEQVYARSWKQSEPFPSFAAALMRETAALACLRLGVLLIDGTPAAAQIWIVWHGKATIFKLAHDEKFTALSPGSLLTQHVMERVLDEGNIREVDFGRGDDPYKQLWLPKRRERWGIMAFNPRTVRGRLAALRHLGGAFVRKKLMQIRRAENPA